jgi:S1-C subfamily serine protease
LPAGANTGAVRPTSLNQQNCNQLNQTMKLTLDSNHRLLGAAALAALLNVASLSAADLAQKARELLAKNQDSFITVSALSKMDMGASGLPIRIGGMGEAQETSCGGLVIDASGLTVASYSGLNPMEKIAGAIKIKMNEDDESTIKTKTQLSRIQMRLADGTEVPARLVLKDKELDLAFLVPEAQPGVKVPKFSPASLAPAPVVKELDEVVAISRHGKTLGYQPIVDTGRVTSVIAKPRTMYDVSTPARPGSPVFLPDGTLLGLAITFGSEGTGLMSIGAMEALVLPTSEIVKLAEQAKKAADKAKEDKSKKESE